MPEFFRDLCGLYWNGKQKKSDRKNMMNLIKKILRHPHKKHIYTLDGIEKGHRKITYRGVPCIKCPFDYVMYQMVINEIKPDLIIEIGTNVGGSAYYMADIMSSIGHGLIHTIDIDDRAYPEVKEHQRIKFFYNGWEQYDLKEANKYKNIMVIEDSSHDYKNTLDAINKFSPLVTPGSYLIVEDGIIDALGWTEEYSGGPVKAIKQFLQVHPEFQIDDKWINMFGNEATFNTMGYLKKIKI